MAELSILHFNDVYRVTPQRIHGSEDTIDVTQFAALLDELREQWPNRHDGKKDGLVLFSGDLFSPSVESCVTRGSHMVPVINELRPDVSLTGNHDFDFGYPHLSKLIDDTTFPWLLSNVMDTETSRTPQHLQEFIVLERSGLKIGVIGLVEKEWIGTVSSWPANFQWRDMTEVGMELSKRLRDPSGEYKCDVIVALTHCRIPNDLLLAKSLYAHSPTAQIGEPIADIHGVDILLGGHDHLYFVSKGVTSWDGYDTTQKVLGAEEDKGDVLVLKSGTDFRDLSAFTLTLQRTPQGSVRRMVVSAIRGKRHQVQSDYKSSQPLKEILSMLLSSVSKTLKAPVCITDAIIDVRSQFIRTAESAAGNLFADIVRRAYDDALCMSGNGGSDGVLLCAGTFRGDSIYGPGKITLGDIMEILPFEDPIVVLEVDGEAIWSAVEAGLETWPAQEGRFPVVSGLRVTWDSGKPPGQRVLSVALQPSLEHGDDDDNGGTAMIPPADVPIGRQSGGKLYKIVTREYMAQGHDGFVALKGRTYLIDDEHGQIMNSIVRKYFLGATYMNKMVNVTKGSKTVEYLHRDTEGMISQATGLSTKAAERWRHAFVQIKKMRSATHYRDTLSIASREHMSEVDCFDGAQARKGGQQEKEEHHDSGTEDELMTVHPVIDERFKDVSSV
ncbi:Metallo-dependent phosphatase [Rickenella mellea]|uniref:Metallo-dependent phosphatase n=1 Tax=Rickenella mellea TaxID=50990 RepID=A0A4Y7QIQ7_9AGAM|nr:Metallo-dependent phosphatase [Rickenella mellea]